MHSHQGMQEQSLMTAPLIVHSPEDMREDRQEAVLMLHDFSFQTPDELLAGLTKSNRGQSPMPKSGMGNDMNMGAVSMRSEEHTSELQSLAYLVCRLLLEKKKTKRNE